MSCANALELLAPMCLQKLGRSTVFGILLDAAEVGMAGYELWGSLLPAYDELKELRSLPMLVHLGMSSTDTTREGNMPPPWLAPHT